MIVYIKIKEVSFNTMDKVHCSLSVWMSEATIQPGHQDVIRPIMSWDIQSILYFSLIQQLHSNRGKSVVYKKRNSSLENRRQRIWAQHFNFDLYYHFCWNWIDIPVKFDQFWFISSMFLGFNLFAIDHDGVVLCNYYAFLDFSARMLCSFFWWTLTHVMWRRVLLVIKASATPMDWIALQAWLMTFASHYILFFFHCRLL